MRQDDAGAAKANRIGHDRTDRQANRSGLAFEPIEVDALRRLVEMGDPKPLGDLVLLPETGSEEAPGGVMAVEQCRGFDTLIPQDDDLRARPAPA